MDHRTAAWMLSLVHMVGHCTADPLLSAQMLAYHRSTLTPRLRTMTTGTGCRSPPSRAWSPTPSRVCAPASCTGSTRARQVSAVAFCRCTADGMHYLIHAQCMRRSADAAGGPAARVNSMSAATVIGHRWLCAGLLVVAKDAESLWKLGDQFKAHTARRLPFNDLQCKSRASARCPLCCAAATRMPPRRVCIITMHSRQQSRKHH